MLALPDELTRFVTASLLNNSARYSQNAFTFHDFLQYYVYYPRHVLCCLVLDFTVGNKEDWNLFPSYFANRLFAILPRIRSRFSENPNYFGDLSRRFCLILIGRKEPGVEVKNKWPIQSSRMLADHFARAQFCRLFHRFFAFKNFHRGTFPIK